MAINIYILLLQQNKYYVGRTDKALPEDRIINHFSGKGSKWTQLYNPIDILEVITNCTPRHEDYYTKLYMDQYGEDNVRGGSYCAIELTADQKYFLKREYQTSQNRCFTCNEPYQKNQCKCANLNFRDKVNLNNKYNNLSNNPSYNPSNNLSNNMDSVSDKFQSKKTQKLNVINHINIQKTKLSIVQNIGNGFDDSSQQIIYGNKYEESRNSNNINSEGHNEDTGKKLNGKKVNYCFLSKNNSNNYMNNTNNTNNYNNFKHYSEKKENLNNENISISNNNYYKNSNNSNKSNARNISKIKESNNNNINISNQTSDNNKNNVIEIIGK